MVKVERKGSYQGVPQWGITGAAEITPSKATAEKWARLENAARRTTPRQYEVIYQIEGDFPRCRQERATNEAEASDYVRHDVHEDTGRFAQILSVLPSNGEPEDEYERRQRG